MWSCPWNLAELVHAKVLAIDSAAMLILTQTNNFYLNIRSWRKALQLSFPEDLTGLTQVCFLATIVAFQFDIVTIPVK